MASDEIKLTEREEAIARKAADMAVQKMTTDFYATVGRNVITRFVVVLGAAAVAFVVGKGWVTFK